jgi:hypothetical protein
MSYFIPGLWHFAAAMACAVALGLSDGGDATLWLHRLEFLIPLIIASSALFWVPESLARKGLMKFLHYPLPDWDVLLLGPASHRHWLTHSPILPLLLVGLTWRYPVLLAPTLPFGWVCTGLSIGIGSHLFWDCVGSRTHKIVIVPYWFALREAPSRIYLLAGALLCLGVALHFGTAHRRRPSQDGHLLNRVLQQRVHLSSRLSVHVLERGTTVRCHSRGEHPRHRLCKLVYSATRF